MYHLGRNTYTFVTNMYLKSTNMHSLGVKSVLYTWRPLCLFYYVLFLMSFQKTYTVLYYTENFTFSGSSHNFSKWCNSFRHGTKKSKKVKMSWYFHRGGNLGLRVTCADIHQHKHAKNWFSTAMQSFCASMQLRQACKGIVLKRLYLKIKILSSIIPPL